MTLEKLKEIISLREEVGYTKLLTITKDKTVYCKEDELEVFLNFITENWNSSEFTFITFEIEFLRGIVEILEKESISVDEENNPAAEVKKNIEKKYPKKKFSVYDKIIGIEVENKEEFGKFTIYNIEKNMNILEKEIEENIDKKIDISTQLKERIQSIKEYKYIIRVEVETREPEIAFKLAEEEYKNFFNMLFIEDFKAIFMYIKPLKVVIASESECDNVIGRVAIAKNQLAYRDQKTELTRKKNYMIEKRDKKLENLWRIISNENLNEYERVIANSIKWLGEAIQEKDIATSFLKAMIVLEGILKEPTEKKGITKNICNRTAVILKQEYTILNIVAQMRKLYSLRCDIAHKGRSKIDNKDRVTLINYVKKVLITLTTDNTYKNIQDMKELVKKLKKECKNNKLK